ncbi:MAG: 16S rRNA (cytosine(1402)-N(4))-methyltransferase RsmH [bacterium]
MYHVPVMLNECLDGLNINPDGIYVDVTFGGGGHSKAILERLSEKGRLFSFDQDLDAMKNAFDDKRFTFVRSNFRYLKNFLRYHGVDGVDGILGDLGVSSHHLDDDSRGFSFRFDGKLDMRMNAAADKTAADILNSYSEEELANVFYYYGELQQSRKLARILVKARDNEPFDDIARFMEIVKPLFQREREKKDLAKLFQALRIEVNHEMDVLKDLLRQVPEVLNENGRLVVMTYHSLEDRLVKNFIKAGNIEGKQEKDFYGRVVAPLKAVNNKVITASEDELNENPRSRSAKLRVAEKI